MTDETPSGESGADEGGRGWRVRQRPLPPDHLTPISTAPPRPAQPLPPAPPATPHPASAPGAAAPQSGPATATGRRRTVVIAVVAAVALFALAGGGAVLLSGGHSGPTGPASGGPGSVQAGNGQAVLTSAVQRVEGGAMRADLSMTQSFSAKGPGGANIGVWAGGEIVVTVHIDQQSATRSELRETVHAPGVNQSILAVLYDDTVYLSTDSGASYQTVTIDRAETAQVSPKSPLEFLQMMGDVKANGDVEVNGVTASSYHATPDPVKVGNYVKNGLATENDPYLDRLLNNIGVTDGSLDAAVDAQGNLISETGTLDIAMDMGAFSPADAGSTLNMHEGITGAFSDYGASISITKPGVVTGPATTV